MKRILRDLLRKATIAAGVEIRQVEHLQTAPSVPRGCLVSFIGMSGCGKSTLISKLVKQGLIERKPLPAASFLGSNFEGRTALDEAYVRLMREALRADIAPWRARFLIETIYADRKLACMSVEECFVQDEGIFHHLPNEISLLSFTETDYLQQLLSNRAIVYCFAAPDIIARRIIRRRNEMGRVIFQYKGKSDAAIRTSLHKKADARFKMLQDIDRFDLPIIKIDTGCETNDAAEEVANFLKSLASDHPSWIKSAVQR